MRALPIGLLAAAVLGWLAAAAAGQPQSQPPGTLVASPRFVPAAGPVLAGDAGVAWVSRRDDRVLDLWVAQIGAPPRRVQRYSGSDEERLRVVALIASATQVGLELAVIERGRASVRAYAGAFGEPLAPVDGLRIEGGSDSAVSAGRAVWVARRCASAEIRTIAPPAIGPSQRGTPRCRLRLRRPLTLRRERLRFGVSCAGFAIDCSARVTVRAGGRVIARGTARYNHSTPPYAAADLRLSPAGERMLRRRPRARLRISARIGGAPWRHTTRRIANTGPTRSCRVRCA